MSSVVRLWDKTTGILTFDSDVATGGVCLGFYTVPNNGGEALFPAYTGSVTGIVIPVTAKGVDFTYDTTTYGYLRFVFPSYLAGYSYVLFVK